MPHDLLEAGDGAKFLDAMIGGATPGGPAAGVKTNRKHKAEFPVANIVVVPEENYRWGSAEAMAADLANEDLIREDGSTMSSYSLLKQSIMTLGVEDPIGLVERADGFHVIYGFTRAVAAQQAGLVHVPAYIYEPSISEAEVELLQMRENSPTMKRMVNWVAETEMFQSLTTRMFNRLMEVARAEGAGKPDGKALKVKADTAVCAMLGRHRSTMRSREHFMRILDPRVVTLARQGRLSCTAAQEFHSGDVDHPFDPAFITAVLAAIKGKEGYPQAITPEKVRSTMRLVRVKGYEDGSAKAAPAPSDETGFEDEDAPARRDEAADDDHAAGHKAGKAQLLKAPDKIRQSPSILRDLSALIAWEALRARGLSLSSTDEEVQKLVGSNAWHKVEGIGFGAGEVAMPPLMETIIGGRAADEPDIERMQHQHEHTAERYVTAAFVHGFMRLALAAAGVRNFDLDDKGWIGQRAKDADGNEVYHRIIYGRAVADAASMPGRVTLLARAKAAWARISRYVPAKGKR